MITPSTKILVTGCGGMLGDAVYHVFKDKCILKATDINLCEDWLEKLDIRDTDALKKMFESFQPDQVLHLAALIDLEYCEKHPDEAFETNAQGVKNVANLCKEYDVTMTYICTAGIFDGEKELYDDDDTPNPLSIYGKAKYEGELAVQKILEPNYFIFRAGWMMGGGPKKDKKFINKIIKQLQDGKTELFVVDDKLGTPTYTVNFAENMLNVLNKDAYGLYNMVCGGSCSRLDVAKEIVKVLGLEDTVKITKVDSSHFAKEYFAPRPDSEKLINKHLDELGLNGMRDWKECLKEYLKSYEYALFEK